VLVLVHKAPHLHLIQFHLAAADTAAKVMILRTQPLVERVVQAVAVVVAAVKQEAQATKEVILQLKVMQAALRCLEIQLLLAQVAVVADHLLLVQTELAQAEMLAQAVTAQQIPLLDHR
jgi:hypothetical protein